uniref:Opioid growth factor receptor 2 n=1 Tax=Anabas testudineus TaxID=64144 RepID=A0AAQ6IG75_ANATE
MNRVTHGQVAHGQFTHRQITHGQVAHRQITLGQITLGQVALGQVALGQVALAMLRWIWSSLLWMWRSGHSFLRFLRGYVTRCLSRVRGLVHSALGWRDGCGTPGDPEVEDPQPGSPESGGGGGGRHDADWDSEEYRVDATDELYCDYDSTWDTEDSQQDTFRKTRRPTESNNYKFSRFEGAARDMQNYRHNYPPGPARQERNLSWSPGSSSNDKPNLEFYLGERRSLPDGLYINDFHNNWKGDYQKLEHVHTFIQWLFPLQEPGMNSRASTLTQEEIKAFCDSSAAKENLLKSYKLMLDFYGIVLCDENTGDVEKALNWRERFDNLDRNTHNCLRITRILKCLGTLGFPHYQYPLVRFFLKETLIEEQLPRVKDSVLNYFVFAVLDKRQRRRLIRFAYSHYEPKDEFVWCPKKIQMIWSMQDAKSPHLEFEPEVNAEHK